MIQLVNSMQPYDRISYANTPRSVGDLVLMYRHRVPHSQGVEALLRREIPRFDGWRVALNDRAWVVDFERVQRWTDDAEDVQTLKTLLVMMCLPGPHGSRPRPFSEVHLVGLGIGLSVSRSKLFLSPIKRADLADFFDQYRWGDDVAIGVTNDGLKATYTRFVSGTKTEPRE